MKSKGKVAPVKATSKELLPAKNTITAKSLGEYEFRCLQRLLNGRVERKALDVHIGTTNAPEYIRVLRSKGLEIKTHRITGKNRDGRSISWGEYELLSSSIARAKSLIGG